MARNGGRKLLDPPSDPVNVAAMRKVSPQDEEDDFDASEQEEESYEDEDGGAAALNDPDVLQLGQTPKIGGGYGRGARRSEMFGEEAESSMGRATSPRLFAQASQFPTCVQLRVWKWENGVPVGLGTIDAAALEEDFVRKFFSAMPRRGEGRAQFRLRPIDIRGHELGQEITTVISEHHSAIKQMREAEEEEREMRMYGRGGMNGRFRGDHEDRGNGGTPQVIVEAPQQSDGGEHMSHIADRMLEVVESRAKALEEALEIERERMREEESRRAQERIDLATNAAQGVQALTERAMKDEAQRAERAMRGQQEQSQMLVTTLTSIFAQQQGMSAQQAEAQRRADEYRLEQERQRADRERREVEDRLRREREEYDARRLKDKEEADFRLRIEREEATRKFEQAKMELEMRLQREREEMERKERREREEAERREKWFAEERMRREEREAREAREREEARARRDEKEREEARMREADRERKEKLEREDKERRELLLKEELRERESERQRQHELRVKEMEAQAARDREHAERMASMARLELEAKSSAAGGDTLGTAMKLFSQFGIPPEEVMSRMFGTGKRAEGEEGEDDEKPPGWMAALPAAMGMMGEFAKAMATRNAAAPAPRPAPQYMAPQQAAPPPPQAPPQQFLAPAQRPPQRPVPQAQARSQQRMLPPPPATTELESLMSNAPVPNEEGVIRMVPESSLAEGERKPTIRIVPNEEEAAPAPVQRPTQASLSELASNAGLNLKAQKAARTGLRNLVKKVAAAEEEKWEELIVSAIMQEVNIYHYANAVTVRAGMLEAGASEELAARVMSAMRASEMVPKDLPYGDGGEA
jgi:hypothetical protein